MVSRISLFPWRRLLGADPVKAAALVGLCLFSAAPARADFFSDLFGGGRPPSREGRPLAAAIPRETVAYAGRESPGSIVVATNERRL